MKEYVQQLFKQHYAVVGKHQHSAVKPCTWLKKSLKNEGVCYKQKFYGIQSHRCLQMTPNIYCNQQCVFCWRSWEKQESWPNAWDSPEEIIEESVKAHRKLISGLGGNEKVGKEKFKEAQNPNQAAISLTGEPTGYPFISELVEELHKRKFTTFVVTNALFPRTLASMTLPTQLYYSLDTPNEEIHKKINQPMPSNSWQLINESLELMPSLDTRKAIRITLVKRLNDVKPEAYAELIEKASPDFVEVKGYMFVGGSRQRLSIANMPRHEEVKQFAEKINERLSYELAGEQPISRAVLLSAGKKKMRI